MNRALIKYIFLFVLVFLCIRVNIFGQQDNNPSLSDQISPTRTEELRQSLDYTKTKKVWVPKQSETKEVNRDADQDAAMGPLGRLIASVIFYGLILVAIIVVIGILISIFSNIKDVRDPHIDQPVEEIEVTDIHEIDLEAMLAEALQHQNYRLAIRAQFLMLLRSLSLKELIHWSIEKTNRDYLREVKGKRIYPNFLYTTNLFDRAWYGEIDVDHQTYHQATSLFRDLRDYVNQSSQI